MIWKKLCIIIPIVSVVTMILWGVIGHVWGQSWLALVVGGMATTILSIMTIPIEEPDFQDDRDNGSSTLIKGNKKMMGRN